MKERHCTLQDMTRLVSDCIMHSTAVLVPIH